MKKLIATLLLSTTLLSTAAFADQTTQKNRQSTRHQNYIEQTIAKLPQDKQEPVRKSLEEGRNAAKPDREQMQRLYIDMKNILTAPKFDKKAFIEKGEEINNLRRKMMKNHNERIADIASTLNADERKIFAEIMPGSHMQFMHKGQMKEGGE